MPEADPGWSPHTLSQELSPKHYWVWLLNQNNNNSEGYLAHRTASFSAACAKEQRVCSD